MDYNYLQYYETLIKYVKAYNIVHNNSNFTNNRMNESKDNGINIIYYIGYMTIIANNYYGD